MEAASEPEKTTWKSRSEVAHDRLVELHVRRVGAEELALAAGLRGGELRGVLVEVVVVEDVGVLLGEPRRDEPADDADVALGTEVRRGAVTRLGEELLLEVGVSPVLDDDVDLAGAEALPGDVLLELLVVDGAAELLLGDDADDVGTGLVADPRVDGHVEVAALTAGLAGRVLVGLGLVVDRPSAAGGEQEGGDGGDGPPVALCSCGCSHGAVLLILLVWRGLVRSSGGPAQVEALLRSRWRADGEPGCGRRGVMRARRRGGRRPRPG